MKNRLLIVVLLFATLGLLSLPAIAQNTRITITGTVLDSISGERIGFITIREKEHPTNGTISEENGTFELMVNPGSNIILSYVGYRTKEISAGKRSRNFTIRIAPTDYELNEVVVKPKRQRYRRKDNPSVELAKNIISHKNDHTLESHDYYKCDRYDRMTYSFNNFDGKLREAWEKKFKFIDHYIDTARLSGSPILPVSCDERIETRYFKKSENLKRTVVEATKHAGLDDMLPNDLVQVMKSEVFPEVDINDNDIFLFGNKFVSPLSSFAPAFYKFYILDSVMMDDGNRYVDLGFAPVIPEQFGFIGRMYVSTDSSYFVKKIELNTPKDINLNFVRNMQITINFKRMPDSTRVCKDITFDSEMNITQNTMGLYASRLCSYDNFDFTDMSQEPVFKELSPVIEARNEMNRTEEYWSEHRMGGDIPKEKSVGNMLDEMRNVPFFYYTEKVLTMLFKGYVPIGDKPYEENDFLVGPINSCISYNSFEGIRLRVGGLTTARLNPHLFGFGYVAYGCKDNEFKYEGKVEYSFKPKKMHANEFPIHSLSARCNYDTKLLGQDPVTSKDNFLLSLKRKQDDKITYERNFELKYTREFWSGFSYNVTLDRMQEYGTHLTRFERMMNNEIMPSYSMTQGTLTLRYAPNERFIQMRTSRVPINYEMPVFLLTHTAAKKGFLDTDFDYQRTDFKFSKRFWLSTFGYIDANLKAGKVWTSSPFTMLCIPNANMAYTIQAESFAQMNPMEFVNDEYASWDLVYFLNGCLFNTIPLFNRLKWREVVSFRGVIGRLSDKNKPDALNSDGALKNPGLFKYPTGDPVYEMGKDPYMEFAVGVENIFRVFRIDYIRRLSYLDHPNINKNGVQVSMHWQF